MITVHHLETSRSTRVLWLLEELGLPYELKVYKRNPLTRLAPMELRKVHPLGKSPVISDGDIVVAESACILEHIAETQALPTSGDLAHLWPERGTPAARQARFWLHYAEGSLMNWLVMKLVFMSIPTQPMPFFVRPIARELCKRVQQQLVDPNLDTAATFIEAHLSQNLWFAGDQITLADFQMCFAVAALLARGRGGVTTPAMARWMAAIESRPAFQRALAKGGPMLMA
jgi:glutathione S-transferase